MLVSWLPWKCTWMQVQSLAKADKETSMQAKLRDRFETRLEHIRAELSKKGGVKKPVVYH